MLRSRLESILKVTKRLRLRCFHRLWPTWTAFLSILRERSLLRNAELKFRSPLQLQTLSSAPREFQDKERVLVWAILGATVVRSRADRDVLFHVDDLLFLIHPDEIQRDLCVFHPEDPGLRLRERKEHAAVGAQMLAVHQSLCTFLGRVGQLSMNDGTSREGNRDQSGLGPIVSRQGIAGERQEEDEGKRK
jgi:hypothetical protein